MKAINEKILKVLKLVLENKYRFEQNDGICNVIRSLYINDEISISEMQVSREYMENNKPWFADLRWNWFQTAYWWRAGRTKPRVKWINKHIKKLKRESNI